MPNVVLEIFRQKSHFKIPMQFYTVSLWILLLLLVKVTSLGPEAIRVTSAKQIESFLLDENKEIYEKVKIYDIGDLALVNSER